MIVDTQIFDKAPTLVTNSSIDTLNKSTLEYCSEIEFVVHALDLYKNNIIKNILRYSLTQNSRVRLSTVSAFGKPSILLTAPSF